LPLLRTWPNFCPAETACRGTGNSLVNETVAAVCEDGTMDPAQIAAL
jgi:hypothetical protein